MLAHPAIAQRPHRVVPRRDHDQRRPGWADADDELCAAATVGFGAIACAAIGVRLTFDAVIAGRYFEDGDGLGYRFRIALPAQVWAVRVKKGKWNCR